MRALATTVALVASVAAAAEVIPESQAPAAGASTSARPERSAVVSPSNDGAESKGTPTPTPTATPPAKKPSAPVVPTQALLDRMGQGDRMYLAGDYRSALFAYQDAVYLQPRYAPARVRLGRAYLALRYPAQAVSQAEAALAEDPESADAKGLLEEARLALAKAQAQAAALAGGAPAAGGATGAGAPVRSGPRTFKLTPPPEDGATTARPPVPSPAPAAPPAEPAGGGPTATPSAAVHYRAALGHLESRDYARAVTELSDAILADPKLAVAYSARGSAQFGLGKYREAAEDYRAAIDLDPRLGTPVYGLAECHRVLGDGKKAAEMYERYARSDASDVRDDLRAIATKRAEELR